MKNINVDLAGEEGISLSDMLGISLDEAIQYVSLPRTVCALNELPILAAIGPYGPYLKYNNKFVNLKPKDGDVLTIDCQSAQQLVTDGIINQKSSKSVFASKFYCMQLQVILTFEFAQNLVLVSSQK